MFNYGTSRFIFVQLGSYFSVNLHGFILGGRDYIVGKSSWEAAWQKGT